MSRKFSLGALAMAFGATALLAPGAEATVMLPLSIEQMAQESVAVVRARVKHQASNWDEGRKRIYTQTTVQVVDPILSRLSLPDTIVLRTLGGEVGEVGMKVAGTPAFTPGEEVVVFLRSHPAAAGEFQVIGMSQGKYSVKRSAKGPIMVVPSVEGLAFARRGTDGVLRVAEADPDRPTPITLAKLRERILEAVTPAGDATLPPATPAVPVPPAAATVTD